MQKNTTGGTRTTKAPSGTERITGQSVEGHCGNNAQCLCVCVFSMSMVGLRQGQV